MKIKNLTTAALSVGGALLAVQSVIGQTYGGPPTQANDLVLGFQNQAGGGTEDYVINLGAPSSIVGKSTVVNLSSDFSLTDFSDVLGGSSSMYGGVIGAANTSSSGTPNTADVYLTELRSGGAGVPAVAGSTQPAGLARQADNTTYSQLSTLFCPAAGSGGLDTGKTWESLVDPANGTGSFFSDTGVNPDSQVSPSTVLYEDLWYTSSSTLTEIGAFTYLGYFTLNLTGASPSLTFTGVSVPPPLASPVASISISGTTVTVVSSGVLPNDSCQLQYANSLIPPVTWANVGGAVVASGTTVTNTDTTATGAERYYRLQLQTQ